MATCINIGRAKAVAQVTTIVVAGPVVVGEVWNVTISGKSISFTATATTVANVVAGLVAALSADGVPTEFTELTWTDASPNIVATGVTSGVPHTITASTNSAGGSITPSTTTAATGPNHWDNAANWSNGAVPVNGDDVVYDVQSPSTYYGLAQSGVTLASLTVTAAYPRQNSIGLPKINSRGYTEYRDDYLAIGVTSLKISSGGRIKINLGSVQTAAIVYDSGGGLDQGVPAIVLKGTHASNTLEVSGGSVGVAIHGGETATLATCFCSGGNLTLGSGLTVTGTLTNSASAISNGTLTGCAVNVRGGTLAINGSTATGAIDVIGTGTLRYNSSGTATSVTCGPGQVNCSEDLSARTFTATTLRQGGSIYDPNRTVTHTAGIQTASPVGSVVAS